MAWEATYLLSPIPLVLLATGSWAQDTVFQQTVEGTNVSVDCRYDLIHRFKEKVWCHQTSAQTFTILVSSLSPDAQEPKYSLWDHPEYHFFTVTMTAVRMRDSGLYICGIADYYGRIIVLKNINLEVSKASTPRMNSWMMTSLTSATSPAIESPPDSWMWRVTIAGVAVAVLLLFGLVLVILYLRNARGRAREVENKCHHIYEDFPGQKEETTGNNQQMVSKEDMEAICYASLIHLNHESPQDSISNDPQPYTKPSPDPLLSVEYASISRNRLPSSKTAAPEVETGD